MNRALWEFLSRMLRGGAVRKARLVRQPRYLVGLILLSAYLIWALFQRLPPGLPRSPSPDLHPELTAGLAALAALSVALILSIEWLFIPGSDALPLREAEFHLLRGAPLSERRIIQYTLFRMAPGLFCIALLLALAFGRRSFGAAAREIMAYLLILALWAVHSRGRSLCKARIRRFRWPLYLLSHAMIIILVAGFWAFVAVRLAHLWEPVAAGIPLALRASGTYEEITAPAVAQFGVLVRTDPLRLILAPITLILRPLFTAAGAAWWLSLLPACVLLLLNNEWVVRSRNRFEEATFEQARRMTVRSSGRRLRRMSDRLRIRDAFRLHPVGRPAVAVYWKNLLMLRRFNLARTIWLGAAIIALLIPLDLIAGAPRLLLLFQAAVGAVLLIIAAVSGLVFPNDLRNDLRYVDYLRAWPLRPTALFAAQALAPATAGILIAAAGIGLLCSAYYGGELLALLRGEPFSATAAMFPAAGSAAERLIFPIPVAVAAMVVATAVVVLSSVVPNVLFVFFPGWTAAGSGRAQGAAAMGTQALFSAGIFAALAAGMLPGMLLVQSIIKAHAALDLAVTVWETPLLAIVFSLPLFLVAGVLIRLGGQKWPRLDPSLEIPDRGR